MAMRADDLIDRRRLRRKLTFWRIVGGLGVGAASVIAPAYIAEVSPAHMRGRLGSLQQLAIVTGIFVALLVDYLLAASAGGAEQPVPWGGDAWRWMFASAAIPALIYGIVALRILLVLATLPAECWRWSNCGRAHCYQPPAWLAVRCMGATCWR